LVVLDNTLSFCSSLQTTDKDGQGSRSSGCLDERQTLVVLDNTLSFCSSLQTIHKDGQGSTMDQ